MISAFITDTFDSSPILISSSWTRLPSSRYPSPPLSLSRSLPLPLSGEAAAAIRRPWTASKGSWRGTSECGRRARPRPWPPPAAVDPLGPTPDPPPPRPTTASSARPSPRPPPPVRPSARSSTRSRDSPRHRRRQLEPSRCSTTTSSNRSAG